MMHTHTGTPVRLSLLLCLVALASPLFSQNTDAYGGSLQLPCPAGPAPRFYTAKIGARWVFCTPAGNAFWLRAVYHVDVDNTLDDRGIRYRESAAAKYGDSSITWGPYQVRRLRSWGFNATAEFSSVYVQATAQHSAWPGGRQPEPMPFVALLWPSYYALRNSGGYADRPVKELVRATKSSVWRGYRGHSPDLWDPNYKKWLIGSVTRSAGVRQWLSGPNNDYLIGLNVDDMDWLQGFAAGPDFQTAGRGHILPGRQQPHLAWIILIGPPTQTSNPEFGVAYTDTKVYSKAALADFLQARYGVIGALNAAWGSNYTTFGSAGAWGSGSGLLDEDGTRSWIPTDAIGLTGKSARLQRDLDDFLYRHAQKYFSDIKSVLAQYAPGRLYFGPTSLGGWGTPPRRQVLQASRASVDVIGVPPLLLGLPDDQARIDYYATHAGDKPWVSKEAVTANPDSYFYAYPGYDTAVESAVLQRDRGATYEQRLDTILKVRTSAGVLPIAGMKWWEFIDSGTEKSNWGLVTRRDNAYDGVQARRALTTAADGYRRGGEERDYSDFLTAVTRANRAAQATVAAGR
jgi:hypothetical protein